MSKINKTDIEAVENLLQKTSIEYIGKKTSIEFFNQDSPEAPQYFTTALFGFNVYCPLVFNNSGQKCLDFRLFVFKDEVRLDDMMTKPQKFETIEEAIDYIKTNYWNSKNLKIR